MPPSQPLPAVTLLDIFWSLIDPLLFMAFSASYLPVTILSLIRTQQFRTFTSPSLFKDAWFARFWASVGPQTRENALPRAGPLIAQARGVVLDIGPGSGEWLKCFDKAKVRKVYGVEPNPDQHPLLRERISEAGLEGIYEIVPVGVEGLGEKWVRRGEVDAVVTIQCLCSVPEPRRMMGELYEYLNEGGTWIVYEHVVVFPWQGWFLKWWQATIDIIWPHFLGGCSITRDSGKWLKEAGSWQKVDLKQPADESFCHVIPHIMGVLTK
ncbi:S-adenosyl-L-methionine-dependent methyltransferase [Leptodontidium sp. 2 PMI_412]|nr:S-adenosyl-L-methionine-dependent methyltransferase [Leptodontidium sp. MPI-SDFR-AT-0119]KAH9218717.1 S-adenosyl-L-methionine-dependent methyltransferase [Leptodontidium sp. 2 PMI_412]